MLCAHAARAQTGTAWFLNLRSLLGISQFAYCQNELFFFLTHLSFSIYPTKQTSHHLNSLRLSTQITPSTVADVLSET